MIQIFGTRKCKNTQKAERFFKERKADFQFRDLTEKGVSKKEFENFVQFYKLEELIDTEGKQYIKRNLKYITHDIETELLEDPLLFKTPIVRFNKKVTVGYDPETWLEFVKESC
ncbi:arsenate reductase [hydrocarbon metagenome]|uniref:Arsenate reductase n=1 Tax=hydrocarbon metagenome TaxID=938273 RepID=A0A0W8FVC1_9ZZZZ